MTDVSSGQAATEGAPLSESAAVEHSDGAERGPIREGKAPERPRHRMVDRVASIMESVARSKDGLTLTEVAKALEAPVSTTQGLMNGLVAVGYLDERNRVYTLGIAPYMLNVFAGRPPISAVRHEQLQDVHSETGLTVVVSVAVGDELIYVDHVSSEPRYAYLAEQHLRRSLLRTSAGWLFLADREQRDLWAYLTAASDDSPEHVDAFLENLTELRDSGVCISPSVRAQGDAGGVSVALRENGRTVAVLGALGAKSVVVGRRNSLLETCLRHASRWEMR